MWKRIYLLYCK